MAGSRRRIFLGLVLVMLADAGLSSCLTEGLREDGGLQQQVTARNGPANDNTIVHLLEWSWRDIAKECESLGDWGYWGVQVSPPQEDVVSGKWWSRYQPVSYKLESRSGSEEDFREMVQRCATHGVAIVVDAVINHMASPSKTPGKGRAGTQYYTKCNYENGYQCRHFHHYGCPGGSCGQCEACNNCGLSDLYCRGSDPSYFFNCNLDLPDLDTSHHEVQDAIAGYLNKLVDIGVAGIRVDAAKHIDPRDLDAILSKVKNPAGLFVNQEVILTDGRDCACMKRDQFYRNGRIWEFNTPSLFRDVFTQQNNMNKIRDMDSNNPGGWQCGWAASDNAHTFVVNHDRLLHAEQRPHTITMFDEGIYSLALMTLLAHPYGQPNILSSFNFDYNQKDGDILAPIADPRNETSPLKSAFDEATGGCGYWKTPNYPKDMKPYLCEHRWTEVRNMVKWRRVAGLTGTSLFQVYNDNVLAITRGNPGSAAKAFFAVNAGHSSFQLDINTNGMPAGTYCNVAYSHSKDCYPCQRSCPSQFTVGAGGALSASIGAQQAIALHDQAMVPARSDTAKVIAVE